MRIINLRKPVQKHDEEIISVKAPLGASGVELSRATLNMRCEPLDITAFQRDVSTNLRSKVFTSAQALQKHAYIQKYGVIKTASHAKAIWTQASL